MQEPENLLCQAPGEQTTLPGIKITRSDVAKNLVEVVQDSVMQNQVFEILAGEGSIEKAVRSV